MYTYTDYFSKLDFELQQERDGGDTASNDKFRKLPSTHAKAYINETIRELVGKNYERFEKEIIFRFFDVSSTLPAWTDGYYNIDINDTSLVSGNTFILPTDIAKMLAYQNANSYWLIPDDSSLSNATIYSPAHNRLYNQDGWLDEDELTVKAIQFPEEIKETISAATVNSTDSSATAYSGTKIWFDFATDPGFKVGDIVTFSGWSESTFNTDHRIIWRSSNGLEYIVDTTWSITTAGTVARNYESRIIEFPDEYIRLLTLEIKRKVYGRIGKAMSESDWFEYREIMNQWKDDTGRVKHKSYIAVRGYGFGK